MDADEVDGHGGEDVPRERLVLAAVAGRPECHGGRPPWRVAVRVLQPILALAAAIWHNHKTGQPTLRSLVAYDH